MSEFHFIPSEVRDPKMRAYLRTICTQAKSAGEWKVRIRMGEPRVITDTAGTTIASIPEDAPSGVWQHICQFDPGWVLEMLDYIDELEARP